MELKHIAPYLPYKTIGISKQGTFFYLSTGCNMRGNGIEDRDIGTWVSNGIKPILHPLSDLTKEIEVNGEKFVPIVKIWESIDEFKSRKLEFDLDNGGYGWCEGEDNEGYEFSYDEKLMAFGVYADYKESGDNMLYSLGGYKDVQKLIEWKFDVFNLIEKGEAINVNTLQTNPYK